MSEIAGSSGGTNDGKSLSSSVESTAGTSGTSGTSSAADGPAKSATAGAEGSGLARVGEWFWLGKAIQAVHTRGSTLTPRGQELLRRARLAAELGGRALEPPEPLPSGTGDAIACELYRESIEWSLAAHQEQRRRVAARADEAASPGRVDNAPSRDLKAFWDAAEPALLAKGAASEETRKQVLADIGGRSYREFAELDSAEQTRIARSLRKFAEGLTGALDAAQNELDRLWLKRVLRLGVLIAVVVGGGVLLFKSVHFSEASRDLTKDAMWSASSVYAAEPGCEPPAQECANSPNFFIATNDDDEPWLMFEFKEPKKISGLRIDNRIDCCYDRAIPMVVEVSDDKKSWKEVTRRTTDFTSWRENFDPVTARYVRLRILKKTYLNLSRVRLFP